MVPLGLSNPFESLAYEPRRMSEFGTGFTLNVGFSFLLQQSQNTCSQALAVMAKSGFMLYYLYDTHDEYNRSEYDYLPYALQMFYAYSSSGCISNRSDPGIQQNKDFDEAQLVLTQ